MAKVEGSNPSVPIFICAVLRYQQRRMSTEEFEEQEPEDRIESSVISHDDELSFYIYDEGEDTQWIRSTITIEQREDDDGYEDLTPKDWSKD